MLSNPGGKAGRAVTGRREGKAGTKGTMVAKLQEVTGNAVNTGVNDHIKKGGEGEGGIDTVKSGGRVGGMVGGQGLGELKVVGKEVVEKVSKGLGAEDGRTVGGTGGEFARDGEVEVSRHDGVGGGCRGDGAAKVVEGRGEVFGAPGGREVDVG